MGAKLRAVCVIITDRTQEQTWGGGGEDGNDSAGPTGLSGERLPHPNGSVFALLLGTIFKWHMLYLPKELA